MGVGWQLSAIASRFTGLEQHELDTARRLKALVPGIWAGLQNLGAESVYFPPPEKNELVLSIKMGCADTVPFSNRNQTPRSDSANLEPPHLTHFSTPVYYGAQDLGDGGPQHGLRGAQPRPGLGRAEGAPRVAPLGSKALGGRNVPRPPANRFDLVLSLKWGVQMPRLFAINTNRTPRNF